MTLTQIVDDILLTVSSVAQEKALQLERRQVEYWVDLYRLILIHQDINDNSIIDPSYITQFSMKMSASPYDTVSEGESGRIVFISEKTLPKLPVLTGRFALLSIYKPYVADDGVTPGFDTYNPDGGIEIPLGDWEQSRFTLYNKYNPHFWFATILDKRLQLYRSSSAPFRQAVPPAPFMKPLDFKVICRAVLSEPMRYYPEINDVHFFRDAEYPIPEEKIPRLKQMILANELQWVLPARDTQQSSQMSKMEEKDMSNNPATLIQTGADLYEIN